MKFNLQNVFVPQKTLRSELQTMIFFEEQIFSYPSSNDRCVQRVNLFNKKNLNHCLFIIQYSWYYAKAYNELADPISSSLCPRNTSH